MPCHEPVSGPPEPGWKVTLPRLPSSEVTTPGAADPVYDHKMGSARAEAPAARRAGTASNAKTTNRFMVKLPLRAGGENCTRSEATGSPADREGRPNGGRLYPTYAGKSTAFLPRVWARVGCPRRAGEGDCAKGCVLLTGERMV